MSSYYLDLHSEKLNLTGAFGKHLQQDFVFRNFQSDYNGTIPSVEGLMVGTPYHPLAQSRYRFKAYESSMALPYKEAGYETWFLTGGKLGWRNLDEFVPNQHFTHVEGKSSILKSIKDAQECEWGVYDEYLFDYVWEKLETAPKNKPQFFFSLTTTNHTPFELPAHYKPYPIALTDSIRQSLLTDEGMAIKNFTNYQYAADCLGRFLDKLKKSPLAENTIVIATGDHNTFMLFRYGSQQLLQKYGVPLYVYVPEKYRSRLRVDTSRFGSHKDILPTALHLSLSEAEYISLGNNLFDSTKPADEFYTLNDQQLAVSPLGAIEGISHASSLYHSWQPGTKQLTKQQTSLAGMSDFAKKVRAHTALLHYYFNEQL